MLKKVFITLVVAAAVFLVSDLVGFPLIFSLVFVAYVIFGAIFLSLLEAPPLSQPRHPVLSVVLFFILASSVLFLIATFLPQYDPREEIAKIKRLQANFVKKELLARQQELAAEMEAAGLQVALVQPTEEAAQAEGPKPPSEELIALGKTVYNDFECYNCHKIGGKGGVKRRGPELDNVGNVLTPELIRKKILDPTVFVAEGFEEEYKKGVMPDTYADQMAPDALEALVAYLSTLKDTSVNTPRPLDPETGEPLQISAVASARESEGGETAPVGTEHMPEGWWTDPEIIAKGKAIYEGRAKPDVNCAACHGRDGKPVLTGAADFRDPNVVNKLSDTEWFNIVANGKPGTVMTGWKDKLTPEEIWAVIAYENTFHTGGKPTEHKNP